MDKYVSIHLFMSSYLLDTTLVVCSVIWIALNNFQCWYDAAGHASISFRLFGVPVEMGAIAEKPSAGGGIWNADVVVNLSGNSDYLSSLDEAVNRNGGNGNYSRIIRFSGGNRVNGTGFPMRLDCGFARSGLRVGRESRFMNSDCRWARSSVPTIAKREQYAMGDNIKRWFFCSYVGPLDSPESFFGRVRSTFGSISCLFIGFPLQCGEYGVGESAQKDHDYSYRHNPVRVVRIRDDSPEHRPSHFRWVWFCRSE